MKQVYKTREAAERAAETIGCNGAHRHGNTWMPCASHDEFEKLQETPHSGRGVVGIETLPSGGLVSAPISGKAAKRKARSDRLAATPAPKKERIFGSSRNPALSASSSRSASSIEIDASTLEALRKKVKEHNDKAESERRTSLATLKAVYRRGAGAYSQTHRPGMTRGQWAMGRVNAFLRMLSSGKPKNSRYVNDNDLLPRDHPWRNKGKSLNVQAAQGFPLHHAFYGQSGNHEDVPRQLDASDVAGVALRNAKGIAVDAGIMDYLNLCSKKYDLPVDNFRRAFQRGVANCGVGPHNGSRYVAGLKRLSNFLYLLEKGFPREESACSDIDLLPENHPWVDKAAFLREKSFTETVRMSGKVRHYANSSNNPFKF